MRALSSLLVCVFALSGCAGFQFDHHTRQSLIDVIQATTPVLTGLNEQHSRRVGQALIMLDFFVEELENSKVTADYISATTAVLEKLSDELKATGDVPKELQIILDVLVVVGATIEATQ